MKKLIRIFAAACVAAAVMVSCSKDDKKPEKPVLESLAGSEWNFDLTFEMSSAEALPGDAVRVTVADLNLRFVDDSLYVLGAEVMGSLMEDSETGELVPVMKELRGQGSYSFKYPAVTLYACDMEPVKYEAPTKGAPEEEMVTLMLSEDGQRLLFDEATEKLLKDNFLAGMDDDPSVKVTLVSDLWFKKAGKVL